jgi:hypothetical protein
MRPPRLSIRTLMAAVAGVALLIGGSLEIARLKRLSEGYTLRVMYARRLSAMPKATASWTHERWLAECRRIAEKEKKEREAGSRWTYARGYPPERARKLVAYWVPMIEKYERAARYPWLPVEPDPPMPEGKGYPKWPPLDAR